MAEIECSSGQFLLVKDFAKGEDVATDTTAFILDRSKLEDWFKKGEIFQEDRLFCIADELLIETEAIKKITLIHRGKTVLQAVV